jgi:cholesterol transport system auxiliary component
VNPTRCAALLAAVCLGPLAVTACGSARYPASYVLTLEAPPVHPQAPPRALGSLLIREFRSPEYLSDGRLVYRPSPEQVGFYEYHRWATGPRLAITVALANRLRAQSLFTAVAVDERGIYAPLVLSGTVDRLEEVDLGTDVRAVCTLSAQLVDTRNRSIVWSDTASEEVPVAHSEIAGVVRSLSAASNTALDRLVASLSRYVASQPPAGGASR